MTTTTPLISDQLVEVLGLVAESDSVELKLTVPEASHRSAIAALELDPLDAQIRQVYFFDTPQLTLNQAGVVARARRIQGKGDDSVIKLRPVVPSELPEELRTSGSLVVEVDMMPTGFVCSGTLKARRTPSPVRDVVRGGGKVSRLFNKEQRSFFKEHAPEGVNLDDLSILGPIFVLKLAFNPPDYRRGRFVVELWLYPDGSRILELSTKCLPSETLATALDARHFLQGLGVELWGEQQTKTKTALEFFAKELAPSS
jgi:hypothetical protein